jgi:hypothetical protein
MRIVAPCIVLSSAIGWQSASWKISVLVPPNL